MNFQTTGALLEALAPYIDASRLQISTENRDWRNRPYCSDLVTIDQSNNVGFEVFEEEIIVYFFTDHCHFEGHGQTGYDYIGQAKEFLTDLFRYPIRHVAVYKGKALAKEKYLICYPDGREECDQSGIWYGLFRFLNPFAKKTVRSTLWQYEKAKGRFTSRSPKRPSTEAVEVVDVSDDS